MENMPYQSHLDVPTSMPAPLAMPTTAVATDWRNGLPTLTAGQVTLRELRASDAPALFAALTSEQVSRFISPPPATVEGFGRFISWAIRQRQTASMCASAVVPQESDTAIGIFQVRSLEPAFGTAEWGFARRPSSGHRIFVEGAKLIVDFAFEVLGVHRLEARAALKNGRGNGALRKLGAVQEGVLRRSFVRNGNTWTRRSDHPA